MASLPNSGDPGFSSSQPEFSLQQLLLDAQTRWLKPAEICEILNNHQRLNLSESAAIKPTGGSLFLFDRNKLRYFRKDGHNWRKKRDGKTVREAHEKLKVGNKDAIHCYYAHGEDNPNFQRRSYWLLEGGYEHIVLVHYREVTESTTKFSSQVHPNNMAYGSVSDYSSPSLISSPSEMASYNSHEGIESGDEFDDNQMTRQRHSQEYQASFLEQLNTQLGLDSTASIECASTLVVPSMNNISASSKQGTSSCELNLATNDVSQFQHRVQFQTEAAQDFYKTELEGLETRPWSTLLASTYQSGNNSTNWIGHSQQSIATKNVEFATGTYHTDLMQRKSGEEGHMMNNGLLSPTVSLFMQTFQSDLASPTDQSSDSTWVDGTLVTTSCTSETPWGALISDQCAVLEGASLSRQFHFNADPDPVMGQKQWFDVVDFTPEWSYAFEGAKVLITGIFVSPSISDPNTRWSCMFGEVEVPAEVLESGALRCIAPPHEPGRVPFYVTCRNGIACSGIQEFEYREKYTVSSTKLETDNKADQKEHEMLHQIKLAELLLTKEDKACAEEAPIWDLEKTEKQSEKLDSLKVNKTLWNQMEDLVKCNQHPFDKAKGMLLEAFFKSALHQWIQQKVHGKGASSIDKPHLGALHMVSALGYEWAIAPILAAGIGVNFRDEHGWTALHWAAFCGREKVIAQLLAADAAPGALTDPTPSDPRGRTASDLAASSGHNGIAAYLGEAIVTSHLSSLNLQDNKGSAAVAVNEAVGVVLEESIATASFGLTDDDLTLRDSLAAVRNAAQAEARITATFRAYSFQRKREMEEPSVNEFGMLEEEARAFAAVQSAYRGYPSQHEKSNLAATQIQCKYRGWKARSEFLAKRKQVVKIQAHVRGHQARRKYKKVLWTVSMLDKVILRWRRKGSGLRGFKAESVEDEDSDDDTYLKDFRKQKEAAFGEAVSRVKQMIQNPEARSQYKRLLEIYRKEKGVQCDEGFSIPDDDELMALLG